MNRQPPAIRIELSRSLLLRSYLHLLHGLLFLFSIASALMLGSWLMLACGAVVLGFWRYAWVRYFEAVDNPLLLWAPSGEWRIDLGQRGVESGQLRDCFNHPWLMLLRIRTGRFTTQCFLLLPDNCDPEQRRRLRLRLQRYYSKTTGAADSYPVS